MEYIFILDKDASVAEIGSQLRLLDGVAWRIDNGNLRVEVPDNLYTTYESRIFDAVASGIWATNGHQHDDEKANESSVLCGALQTRLLNRYLPSMFESMTSGIVIEVESIEVRGSCRSVRLVFLPKVDLKPRPKEKCPAPSHNILHFCVRELGTSSKTYPAIALRRFSEQVLTHRSLICFSVDA